MSYKGTRRSKLRQSQLKYAPLQLKSSKRPNPKVAWNYKKPYLYFNAYGWDIPERVEKMQDWGIKAKQISPNQIQVDSQRDEFKKYIVESRLGEDGTEVTRCNCPYAMGFRGNGNSFCKHVEYIDKVMA